MMSLLMHDGVPFYIKPLTDKIELIIPATRIVEYRTMYAAKPLLFIFKFFWSLYSQHANENAAKGAVNL